jgi:hypothetical protein
MTPTVHSCKIGGVRESGIFECAGLRSAVLTSTADSSAEKRGTIAARTAHGQLLSEAYLFTATVQYKQVDTSLRPKFVGPLRTLIVSYDIGCGNWRFAPSTKKIYAARRV